jgi:hypothetical protein
MYPDQLSGQKVDARSDVFSAGVVLAEMIHPEGVFSQKTREEIWNAVRHHPMQLTENRIQCDPFHRWERAPT